jgi:hypothetical protein
MPTMSHVPTPESRLAIKTAAGLGASESYLTHILKIDVPTLKEHYQHEIDTGAAEMSAPVLAKLRRQADSAIASPTRSKARKFLATHKPPA